MYRSGTQMGQISSLKGSVNENGWRKQPSPDPKANFREGVWRIAPVVPSTAIGINWGLHYG